MTWWWHSRGDTLSARLAQPTDRPVLSALLTDTWRRQGPPAVEEQVALLRNGLSAIALTRDRAVGFMGIAPRMPAGAPEETWADLAMAAVAADRQAGKVLGDLLGCALPALRAHKVTGLGCLAGEGWLRDGLATAGFVQVDRVLGYAQSFGHSLPQTNTVALLRPASAPDFDTALKINAAAFEPFWQYDAATVLSWLLTSDHAVMAEMNGQVVGFAVTALSPDADYAYLIRVATLPAFRGSGVGRQLVVDALEYARSAGVAGLGLNTQASNTVSRHLYESLGFRQTGQSLAVLVYPT